MNINSFPKGNENIWFVMYLKIEILYSIEKEWYLISSQSLLLQGHSFPKLMTISDAFFSSLTS